MSPRLIAAVVIALITVISLIIGCLERPEDGVAAAVFMATAAIVVAVILSSFPG